MLDYPDLTPEEIAIGDAIFDRMDEDDYELYMRLRLATEHYVQRRAKITTLRDMLANFDVSLPYRPYRSRYKADIGDARRFIACLAKARTHRSIDEWDWKGLVLFAFMVDEECGDMNGRVTRFFKDVRIRGGRRARRVKLARLDPL